jgi:hypothetical protein
MATAVFDELQVTFRPTSVFPAVSRTVAVSCRVSWNVRESPALAGVTITDATGSRATMPSDAPHPLVARQLALSAAVMNV